MVGLIATGIRRMSHRESRLFAMVIFPFCPRPPPSRLAPPDLLPPDQLPDGACGITSTW